MGAPKYGTTLPPITADDVKSTRTCGDTYLTMLRVLERYVNWQIEKHSTGFVTAGGGWGGGGYSGGQSTAAAVIHMNTTATAQRAYVTPGALAGASMCPANVYARLVYRTDAAPGTAVELATWTAVSTTVNTRTALTLAVTAIPSNALVYFEFSVPNVLAAFYGTGHVEFIRTLVPA